MDAVLLLRPEQVVDQQLDSLGDPAAPGEALVVQLVRQLERVPVADRLEELDVASQLAALQGDDQERARVRLPEAVLGELASKCRLGQNAEREVSATVRDVHVRGIHRVEIGLANRAELDQSSLQHGRQGAAAVISAAISSGASR